MKSDTVSTVSLFPKKWRDQMPWSSFSECWALSQLFHSLLLLSSRGFLVPLHFLPKYLFQPQNIIKFFILILYYKQLKSFGHHKHELVSNFFPQTFFSFCVYTELILFSFIVLLFYIVFQILCGVVIIYVSIIFPMSIYVDIIKAKKNVFFFVSFPISFLMSLIASWLLNKQ